MRPVAELHPLECFKSANTTTKTLMAVALRKHIGHRGKHTGPFNKLVFHSVHKPRFSISFSKQGRTSVS